MGLHTGMESKDGVRINYSSKSPWEPLRGYSRAVVVGDHLYISGTTALSESGDVVGPGDAYEQTRYILANVRRIVAQAGFDLRDIVRTRLFVTNMAEWDRYARAHREVFENIRPASSIVQVAKLVDPRLMIELEVEALKGAKSIQSTSLA